MSKKIIAIEGGVCTGKTTFIKSKLVPYIPEYWTYHKEFINDLIFSPTSITQILENNKVLVKVELKRNFYLSSIDSKEILLDRSYLSLLAFDYAYMRMFEISGFDKIVQFWKDNFKIQPNEVIFLDIPHQERILRFKRRGKECRQTILLTEPFNNYFKEFFSLNKDVYSKIKFIDN